MKAFFANFNKDEGEELLLPGAEYMLSGQEMDERLTPLLVHERDERQFQEKELIHMIHDNAKRLSNREVVTRTDLFYDMFPATTIDENECVWCIPIDHPLHIVLDECMEREYYAVVDVEYLQVPVGLWLSNDVQDAVDYVIAKKEEEARVIQAPVPDFTDKKKDK